MIVKNEEHNLGICLESVKDIVDEIIIVDTGSADKTVEIAKEYTDKIYHFEWINDFAAARTFSFSKGTKDYLMWLDADDVVEEDSRKRLLELKETLDPDVDIVTMHYRHGLQPDGSFSILLTRERLMKRSRNFVWKNKVHETIDLNPEENNYKVVESDIYITHRHKVDMLKSLSRNLQIIEELVGTEHYGPQEACYHGLTLQSVGKIDESLEVLNKYFEMIRKSDLAPRINAYLNVYEIYMNRGDFQAAYQLLEDNETYLKDKSEYYTTLGDFAKDILSDYESAIFYYEKAIKCEGNDFLGMPSNIRMEEYYYFKPYYALGHCYLKLGRYEDSVKAFKKASKYDEPKELTKILEKTKRIAELIGFSDDDEDQEA